LFCELFPFYHSFFQSNDKSSQYRQELGSALGVADRLHGKGNYIPEHMLLGLLLLPWARQTFPFLSSNGEKKSGDAYAMSRSIRQELDTNLLHLNLKKAIREQIAGLLSHLPLFSSNDRDKWPRWLSKKSYFKERSHFYMMYKEAYGGQPVEIKMVAKSSGKPTKKKKSGPSRGGRRPAFSIKEQKGGVFGFK
jgi:poly(A) polymerase